LRDQASYEQHQALEFWALPKNKSACVFLNEKGKTSWTILSVGLCSVYQHRPTACRGFQVTSDPYLCSKEATNKPTSEGFDRKFSIETEIIASAAIGLEGSQYKTLPRFLLEQLEKEQQQAKE
jgi:Fe-S-cluster containining protein